MDLSVKEIVLENPWILLVPAADRPILLHIQNILDRCFKRKNTSKRMDIRELLEKADKKLFTGTFSGSRLPA